MGSMHTRLEHDGQDFSKLAAFYAERARGGVDLMITGGFAPNTRGAVAPGAGKLSETSEVAPHKLITQAVRGAGAHICLQILHAGRYAMSPQSVAPSAIQSPINPFKPRKLSARDIEQEIGDFVRCAELARLAGYHGVEIMGSEGYLINEFLVKHSNQREDEWGGEFNNRMRFPLEILRRMRVAVGADFLIIFRLSLVDLIPNGSTWPEVVLLAKELEAAGANLINSGIGWHEARVPTIASLVPPAGYAWLTGRLKSEIRIPLVAVNRINSPETAEEVLRQGQADMVSMARPLLADADFVNKAKKGKSETINTCIACNQACLDHIFKNKTATCLVNPRACRETELNIVTTDQAKRIAVIGGGPAGMSSALTLARCGHRVDLYEAGKELGGQFNLAKVIPGKTEYAETIRYYQTMLRQEGVNILLEQHVGLSHIIDAAYEHVVLATGVIPRIPDIPGIDLPLVCGYDQLLRREREAGERVIIIGAGGIGFDVAEFLLHGNEQTDPVDHYLRTWGVDKEYKTGGALCTPHPPKGHRKIFLLQRRAGKFGAGLGKTTGWIHRAQIKMAAVQTMGEVEYLFINAGGMQIKRQGETQFIAADTIVICAGQTEQRELVQGLEQAGLDYSLIGGVNQALELDAQRAIDEGYRHALSL